MTQPTVDVGNAEIVPRADYTDVLKQIIDEGHCPFCEEHLLRHHRKPILVRSSHWIVTENSWPYAGSVHHFLLITLEHVERIEDLSLEGRIDFFQQYDALSKKFSFEGATILWRSGNTRMTSASVNHLHAHIIVGVKRNDSSKSITGIVGFRQA